MSADLRALAANRLAEAEVLLVHGFPSGAYYLSGYAVECGLKAVIVRSWQPQVATYGLPPRNVVTDTYVHDLTRLVKIANLGAALDGEATANPRFRAFWEVVKDWNESSRYELWTRRDAEDIVEAVGDSRDGVMRWLQRHW